MSGDYAHRVEFWKSDTEPFEGLVHGVVLEANLVDSQGDIATPEEIMKACHEYMCESRKSDVQHSGVDAGAALVENWVAPHDIVIAGRKVTGGSWLQTWMVTDPVLKQEVAEGKRTGFSIEGSAERIPMAA